MQMEPFWKENIRVYRTNASGEYAHKIYAMHGVSLDKMAYYTTITDKVNVRFLLNKGIPVSVFEAFRRFGESLKSTSESVTIKADTKWKGETRT